LRTPWKHPGRASLCNGCLSTAECHQHDRNEATAFLTSLAWAGSGALTLADVAAALTADSAVSKLRFFSPPHGQQSIEAWYERKRTRLENVPINPQNIGARRLQTDDRHTDLRIAIAKIRT